MEENKRNKKELINKSVVDAKGKLIGKSIDFVEDEEPYLVIIVETDDEDSKKSKIPLDTIQAVGEMIVLNVEVEGVRKEDDIVALNGTGNKVSENEENNESQNSNSEDTNETKSQEDKITKDEWVLFKSIKS